MHAWESSNCRLQFELYWVQYDACPGDAMSERHQRHVLFFRDCPKCILTVKARDTWDNLAKYGKDVTTLRDTSMNIQLFVLDVPQTFRSRTAGRLVSIFPIQDGWYMLLWCLTPISTDICLAWKFKSRFEASHSPSPTEGHSLASPPYNTHLHRLVTWYHLVSTPQIGGGLHSISITQATVIPSHSTPLRPPHDPLHFQLPNTLQISVMTRNCVTA